MHSWTSVSRKCLDKFRLHKLQPLTWHQLLVEGCIRVYALRFILSRLLPSTTSRVGWKVHRLTKILSWNVTKMRLIFQHSLHTSSISVEVLGSYWSKMSSKQIWLHHMNFSTHSRNSQGNGEKLLILIDRLILTVCQPV